METGWQAFELESPLRQGDLLAGRSATNGTIDRIYLVLTADCDITNDKFGRDLFCLRVIPFEQYVRTIWAERKLDSAKEKAGKNVLDQVRKWHTLKLGGPSTLSAEALATWIMRSDAAEICAQLEVPEKEQKSLIRSLTKLRAAYAAVEKFRTTSNLHCLAAFQSAVNEKDETLVRQDLLTQAQESFPDDVFMLPTLPQLDVEPALVLLREARAVPFDNVCFRAADAKENNMLLRIGRLEPTIKYAVSQAFGTLYSRIGLSKVYEDRCKLARQRITALSWE